MSNLLIVDDEPSMRQRLTLVFGREGHSVRASENGRQALAALRIELQCFPDVEFNKLDMSSIRFHLNGESTLIHTARLTWKPAPPSEAPRETSTPGPKPSSTMKPTLNSIHMDPAVRASAQSRRGGFGMKRSAAREVPTPGASR